MKGFFITVEGMDGCGKTTQINKMVQYLRRQGRYVVTTREPGGTSLGEKIRQILLDVDNKNMSAEAELMLYAASRAQLVSSLVLPAVSEGKIVICDRFVDSSIAYQGFGRNLGMDVVEKVNSYALQGCKPDLTIFFDVSPQEVLYRKIRSDKEDRIESETIEFHERVYQGYQQLARQDKERIKIIDARRSVEEIFIEVRACLDLI